MISHIPSEERSPHSGKSHDHVKLEPSVSMVAFKACRLALVSGKRVFVLDVTNGLKPEAQRIAWQHDAPEQISAVELLRLRTESEPIKDVFEGKEPANKVHPQLAG